MFTTLKQQIKKFFLPRPPRPLMVNPNVAALEALLKQNHLLTKDNQAKVRQFHFKYKLYMVLCSLHAAGALTAFRFEKVMAILEKDYTGRMTGQWAEAFDVLNQLEGQCPDYFDLVLQHPQDAVPLMKGLVLLHKTGMANEENKQCLIARPNHAEKIGQAYYHFFENNFFCPTVQAALMRYPEDCWDLMGAFFGLPQALRTINNFQKLTQHRKELKTIQLEFKKRPPKTQAHLDHQLALPRGR